MDDVHEKPKSLPIVAMGSPVVFTRPRVDLKPYPTIIGRRIGASLAGGVPDLSSLLEESIRMASPWGIDPIRDPFEIQVAEPEKKPVSQKLLWLLNRAT